MKITAGMIKTGDVIKPESQLDRIEKKMDRILELLEGKELSTSIVMDGKKVAETVIQEIDRLNRRCDRLNLDNLKRH